MDDSELPEVEGHDCASPMSDCTTTDTIEEAAESSSQTTQVVANEMAPFPSQEVETNEVPPQV